MAADNSNNTMNPVSLEDFPAKEILPGFIGKFIHSEKMTMAYWTISESAALPEHSHHHEQVVNMLEGEFELTLNGTPHHLRAGDVLIIRSNVPHSGKAISDCRILDVFQPARDDYR